MQHTLPLAKYLPNVSTLAYGCMGLGGGWNDTPVTNADVVQSDTIIQTALEHGITLFDHADIYTFSKAEEAFGRVLKNTPSLRDKMYVQSKCGIRFEDDQGCGRYDFSAAWVQQSVEGSLRRLHCEKLDILLLHRPDPLMELEEIANTLQGLHKAGKVDHIGVSNMNQYQISFLQSALTMPIVANQLELSLAKTAWLDDGIAVNTPAATQAGFPSGLLEHCRSNHIQLQAWGCLAQGAFGEQGLHSEDSAIANTTRYVWQLAQEYNVTAEAIVLAFLLKHPSAIQPVIGTTNTDRIRGCADAVEVNLTREQWYNLYVYSRGQGLP